MELTEFIHILENWGRKDDIINKCNIDCKDCKLNEKIFIKENKIDICGLLSKINKHLRNE